MISVKNAKKVLALLLAVIMILGIGSVLAMGDNAANGSPSSEKTARFIILEGSENSMISECGELVIHISDETPIVFEDDIDVREALEEGQVLLEVLDGRKLVVTYSITTRSIPPQTTPEKIVVMYEVAVHLPIDINGEAEDGLGIEAPIGSLTLTEEELDEMYEVMQLNGEVVMFGELIDMPSPFLVRSTGRIDIMVPLRAIAEELGYDVNWDHEVQGVRLGASTNLWIGRDEYVVGRMAPVELGVAPALVDGVTFVPMTFFRDVLGYNIFSFEGQVVFTTPVEGEDM